MGCSGFIGGKGSWGVRSPVWGRRGGRGAYERVAKSPSRRRRRWWGRCPGRLRDEGGLPGRLGRAGEQAWRGRQPDRERGRPTAGRARRERGSGSGGSRAARGRGEGRAGRGERGGKTGRWGGFRPGREKEKKKRVFFLGFFISKLKLNDFKRILNGSNSHNSKKMQ
jgi:hypothetical protein